MDYAKIFAQNLPMEQGVIEKSDKNGNKALTSEQRKVVRRYSDALSKNYILNEVFSEISPKKNLKKNIDGVTIILSRQELSDDLRNELEGKTKVEASVILEKNISVAVTGIQTKGPAGPIIYVSQKKAEKIKKNREVLNALEGMIRERDFTRIPARITYVNLEKRIVNIDIGDYGIPGLIRFEGWEGDEITEDNFKELVGTVCHVSAVGRYGNGIEDKQLAGAFKCITKTPKAGAYEGLDRRYPVGSTIVGTVKSIEDKCCWARIEGEEVNIMLYFPWDRDGDYEWDKVVSELTCGHTYSILVTKNEPMKKLLRGRILHELPDRVDKELEQKVMEDVVKSRKRQIFNISPSDRNWGLPDYV